MFGFLKSESAISAAFFSDVPTPAPPCPDSGRIKPTRTWPSPICRAGRRRRRRWFGLPPNLPKLAESNLLPAQADSASAVLAHSAARSLRLRVSDPGWRERRPRHLSPGSGLGS